MRVNFFPDLGDLTLLEITPLLVEKWRLKKLNKGIKAATVNRDIAFLKAALAKAVEWNFIESTTIAKVKPIKVDKSAKVRYLDKEEVTRLRNVLNEREEKLIEGRKSANAWRRERGYPELPIDLAMGGIDLNTIRELLGHSDIQMTLRYAHLAPQHKAKAVAVLLEE